MKGLKRNTVALWEHDKEWETEAERTGASLRELFGSVALDVQHVGSTAIGGIPAKPIIDMAVAVESLSRVTPLVPALEKAGFILRSHKVEGDMLFVRGDFALDTRSHHIHVVPADSAQWRDYINFRDYLRAFPEKAVEYSTLKRELALKYAGDREAYTEGKAGFISRTLRLARAWSFLGERITVTIDRPLGSAGPDGAPCPLNAGFAQLPGGWRPEVYVMGPTESLDVFEGLVAGAVYRDGQPDDRLVAAPPGMAPDQTEIAAAAFLESPGAAWFFPVHHRSCGTIPCRRRAGKEEYLVILQRRSGTWSFPKGHAEPGETETQTALRETFEETGLRPQIAEDSRVVAEYASAQGRYNKTVALFPALTDGEVVIDPAEATEYRWVTAAQAKELLPVSYHGAVLAAERFLRAGSGEDVPEAAHE